MTCSWRPLRIICAPSTACRAPVPAAVKEHGLAACALLRHAGFDNRRVFDAGAGAWPCTAFGDGQRPVAWRAGYRLGAEPRPDLRHQRRLPERDAGAWLSRPRPERRRQGRLTRRHIPIGKDLGMAGRRFRIGIVAACSRAEAGRRGACPGVACAGGRFRDRRGRQHQPGQRRGGGACRRHFLALCRCRRAGRLARCRHRRRYRQVPHHFELVKAAVGAGKHVYCEWPLSNALAEAEEMAALARQRACSAWWAPRRASRRD